MVAATPAGESKSQRTARWIVLTTFGSLGDRDQCENAARLTGLEITRTVSWHRYSSTRIAAELRSLLDDPEYSQRASRLGKRIRREDGKRPACDALEELLRVGLPKRLGNK